MVERYSRNESKEANDDIAEVVYHVADERTSVTCHREDSKISATTRDFIKPSLTDDKGASGVTWNVDSYAAFLVQFSSFPSLVCDTFQYSGIITVTVNHLRIATIV